MKPDDYQLNIMGAENKAEVRTVMKTLATTGQP